jgi:hypothetical protein
LEHIVPTGRPSTGAIPMTNTHPAGAPPWRNALRVLLQLGVLVALALCVALAWASPKKGIGMGRVTDPTGSKLAMLNVAWYYNWSMNANADASRHCFVPMYWGGRGQLKKFATPPPDLGPVLLAFNEPDFREQSNRSVDEVLEEWSTLQGWAPRIGGPHAAKPLDAWMREFVRRADTAGLRVDFIGVHWYGAPNAEHFLRYLDNIHRQYQRPIWITEFAPADWKARAGDRPNRYTHAQVQDFMRAVLPELERRPYIERYAWFSSRKDNEVIRTSKLFNPDGTLTELGRIYAEFGDQRDANCPGPAKK